MIGQSLPFVCALVISFIAISSNLKVISSDLARDKRDSDHGNGHEQKEFESSKSLRKRNTFDEYGNLDLHYKTNTKETKSKVWFQFTSPTPAYLPEFTDNNKPKDQGQGPNEQRDDAQYVYRTLKTPSQIQESSNDGSFSITYVGCFSTWERQFTHLETPGITYDDSQLHTTCASKCRQKGEQLQVSFVKGGECLCSPVFGFNSSLKHESYCNIPCPVRDFHYATSSRHEIIMNPCGGNQAYSVYCISGPGDCQDVLQDVERQLRAIEARDDNSLVLRKRKPLAVLEQRCAKCGYNSLNNNVCTQPFLHPDFDYFPVNSPEKCVQYCGSSVPYVIIGQQERERPPTRYALLFWWKTENTDVPICRCTNTTTRDYFIDMEDPSHCNMTCPGKESICGGKEQDQVIYATVYCVDYNGNGRCGRMTRTTTTTTTIGTTTTTIGTTTSSTTTTDSPSGTEDPDPCDEDADCDDPGGTIPPKESSSTEESTTDAATTEVGISTTEESTTTVGSSSPPTTTPSSTTTTIIPKYTTSTASTTSTSTLRSTTTTSTARCKIRCREVDRHGYPWDVCAGQQASVPCTELNKYSYATGNAFWNCSENGNFETAHPNVSDCMSKWLEKKNEEVEKIKDISEADTFVNKLAESCRNALHPNSSTKYYGHEIKDITSLVDLTVSKAREFHAGSMFPELESVVDTAIELNAFLIQYHDPWKDLPLPEKSAISTEIIENTEDALFHLIQEVHEQDYTRNFTLNKSDANKFLILASTFDKKNNILDKRYEFPPKSGRDKHDSYIKLPDGWGHLVPSKQIEIAAMSIDSEYISNIMPGQYINFVSSSTLENSNASDTKLMNSRLMSFTLMSSLPVVNKSQQAQDMSSIFTRPSMSFTGKGVEITFHHDIEAWGDDVQHVRRNLHDGELPKAVLGSSECVYFDTKTLSWSSRGCKVMKSNRYETVCECNHLTSFAILMDVHRYVGKEFGLELLTLILCPLSEMALVVSIILLSSVSGLQKIRATITKNLSACLLVGNALVLFVLDRNYFNMNDGVCLGAAMITHYVFLSAFMWMLIEGIQLYRMVVHVFDSGRSYIKHFGIFAYGSPLIVIAITATTGFLKGDKPYGGDVYCWLEGPYIWSFLGPVALVTTANLVILFIALKTAYQVQQNKKHSSILIMGKLRSCRTWFKGCFSLTVILGLTWLVGFFTLMKAPGGIIAAYIFTILNASQGLFIFFFNCVFNEKVRSFTQRNLSTYLPSWLSSSSASNQDPGGSVYGKRPLTSMKSGESGLDENRSKKRPSARQQISRPTEAKGSHNPEKLDKQEIASLATRRVPRIPKVDFVETKNIDIIPVRRCESIGTISSLDSIPNSSASETGHISSDNSQSGLISKVRFY